MPILQPVLALLVVVIAARLIDYYYPMPGRVRPIIHLVLALIVVGMALWLINVYVPMAASIKAILNIVVVVATCVGVLQVLGLWPQVVRMWSNLTSHFS
jgi:undecaprenyl pyrophosphate phosphatase UppP